MDGYNGGFDVCSGGDGNGNGGGAEGERDNDGGTNTRNSGYELTVQVSEWPFGSDSIRINIETANGYTDNESVGTAVSGTPSVTFDIPPNQGGSVSVSADPEGILAFGNCNSYITNDQDTTVTISAR